MSKKRIAIFIFLLILKSAAFVAKAEVFRTQNTVLIRAQKNSSETKKVGINSSVAVLLPKDLTFVQGVEIQIKIPQIVANNQKTITYSLYNDVVPVPTEKEIDYSGKQLYSALYPGVRSWSIVVPLVKSNSIKQSPYADKTLVPNCERGFVFLRNQLAMKGVPKSLMDAQFDICAKLVPADFGALKVNAVQEKGDFSILVDEESVAENAAGLIFLKPGKHNVSVVSEKFRNEVRTIVVEQAKVTEISLNLQSVEPTFSISAPHGTRIFVDGEEVADFAALRLESGSHIFKFSLGGYEVVKNVDVQNGKNYEISVNFDAVIKEEAGPRK